MRILTGPFTRGRNSLTRKSAFLLGAICTVMACDRGPGSRANENQTTSTAITAGDSANGTKPVQIDSAHGAPAALVASSVGAADTTSDIVGLRCTPAVFSQKDTITLRMESPHGDYLMVSQPDSTAFFLSYPDSTEPRNFFLVQADSFALMSLVRFRADVKSRPRVYGRDTLETVFSKPGKYLLTIGRKLESEHATDIHRCTIRLVASKP
jgi:hypothetical protein